MPSSSVLFVVPQETSRLAEILQEHGGYLEFEHVMYDFTGYLAARVGERLTAEFGDLDDPDEALCDFARELVRQGVPFFGVCDSFEERSRGIRFEGYVAYHFGGGEDRLNVKKHPWVQGDASLDDRSLRKAGVSDEDIDRINAVLHPAPQNRHL